MTIRMFQGFDHHQFVGASGPSFFVGEIQRGMTTGGPIFLPLIVLEGQGQNMSKTFYDHHITPVILSILPKSSQILTSFNPKPPHPKRGASGMDWCMVSRKKFSKSIGAEASPRKVGPETWVPRGGLGG